MDQKIRLLSKRKTGLDNGTGVSQYWTAVVAFSSLIYLWLSLWVIKLFPVKLQLSYLKYNRPTQIRIMLW